MSPCLESRQPSPCHSGALQGRPCGSGDSGGEGAPWDLKYYPQENLQRTGGIQVSSHDGQAEERISGEETKWQGQGWETLRDFMILSSWALAEPLYPAAHFHQNRLMWTPLTTLGIIQKQILGLDITYWQRLTQWITPSSLKLFPWHPGQLAFWGFSLFLGILLILPHFPDL